MTAYAEASKAVFAIFADITPLVEGISIDEAFLDVGGLHRICGPPLDIAAGLRRVVRARVGLAITVGVARTKFLAKVASRVAKPDGLLSVPPGGELEFLHPLPVERLWGVGRVTSAKLRERGIRTVGDVAELEEPALVSMLGPASGRHLHALAHNRDPRPVDVGRRRRSIGSQRALGRARLTPAELEATLAGLVDRVTRRLRRARRVCRTVVLRMRFDDFRRATRSHTFPSPTDNSAVVLAAARAVLTAVAPLVAEAGLTLIGITLTNLDHVDAVQLELPFRSARLADLDHAMDGVRDRYGTSALTRAALLGRDQDLGVPLLPD
jgi:DNA polymerase-4